MRDFGTAASKFCGESRPGTSEGRTGRFKLRTFEAEPAADSIIVPDYPYFVHGRPVFFSKTYWLKIMLAIDPGRRPGTSEGRLGNLS